MKKLLVVAVILLAGWQYFQRHSDGSQFEAPADWNQKLLEQPGEPSAPDQFSCDGRTRCPEMTSCAEARFFLQNCPGTKMDGDHDGIPCEDQLCGHQ
jgi:hypothetical protein